MNVARHWQQEICNIFETVNVTFLNPRRDNWDSTISQQSTDPKFFEQVSWELDALDYADIVVFFFDSLTKSPVTMLELGAMVAKGKKCLVCCPTGFWRKGNVDIFCSRHGVDVLETFEQLTQELSKELIKLNTNT